MVALAFISYIFKIFIGGFIIFIGKKGLVIGGLFKAVRVKVDNIKGVNKYNLR